MKKEFTIPEKKPFKNVFQFKITLLDTNPPVWRRIQVPESYTFYDLHVAIQNSMGWTDSHLHIFKKESVIVDCPYAAGEYEEDNENTLYTTETPLARFFKKEKDSMFYTYDFGDNWEHEIVLEKILAKELKVKYPICLDGELACPPDDCGSIPGYYHAIETVKDKKDKEFLRWLEDWDPYNFNPKEIIFEDPKKRFIESWD